MPDDAFASRHRKIQGDGESGVRVPRLPPPAEHLWFLLEISAESFLIWILWFAFLWIVCLCNFDFWPWGLLSIIPAAMLAVPLTIVAPILWAMWGVLSLVNLFSCS